MNKKSNPIVIESDTPPPAGKWRQQGKLFELRTALRQLKSNQSFLWERNKAPYDAARQLGIRIQTRKENGTGYRVWRVFEKHNNQPHRHRQ